MYNVQHPWWVVTCGTANCVDTVPKMVISALTVTVFRFSPPAQLLLCVKTAKERNHCIEAVAGEA